MIVGLLLAAGAARRFGAPKLIQPLGGKPVIRWGAESLSFATDWLLVVVPPQSADLRAALHGVRARFVTNPEPERGLGRSIACGVDALPSDADAVVIALGDEPLLKPAWIHAVIATYRQGKPAAIVAPVFRGSRRHPVLFDRDVYAELTALDGDSGARDVIERDPGRVALVELDEPATIDVDTPEDLARLAQEPQFTASRSQRHTSS